MAKPVKPVKTAAAFVLDLDPRVLLPAEGNRKIDEDTKEFKDLVLSVQTIGVRHPLMVTAEQGKGKKSGETFYRIQGGHRRALAAIAGLAKDVLACDAIKRPFESKCSTVPCLVVGGEWGMEVAAIENLHRRSLTTGERIRLYEGLKAQGWVHEKIADSVGESRSAISNMLGIRDRLCKPLQDLLDKHDSLQIGKLLRVGALPKEAQEEAWEAFDGVPKPSDKGKEVEKAGPRERQAKAVMVITVRADGMIETSVRKQEGGTPGQEDKPESWGPAVPGTKAGTFKAAGIEVTVRRVSAK